MTAQSGTMGRKERTTIIRYLLLAAAIAGTGTTAAAFAPPTSRRTSTATTTPTPLVTKPAVAVEAPPPNFPTATTSTELRLFGRNGDDEKKKNEGGGKQRSSREDERSSSDDDDDEGKGLRLPEPLRTARLKLLTLLTSTLPPPILDLLQSTLTKLTSALPSIRLAASSFTVGLILATFTILYPVYQSYESTPQPVMLFETILDDLDRGYVDRVDTERLFETGVRAMLSSLDPYTEFEGRSEAAELTESVRGVYGGVGLVISGAVADVDGGSGMMRAVPTAPVNGGNEAGGGGGGAVDNSGGSKLLPQDAIDDNDADAQNDAADVALTDDDLLDPEDLDDDYDPNDEDAIAARRERRRAMARARQQGIRVVNAFEGYAYDYGMRVGDKLVAVDGDPITAKMTVEDVRNRLRGEPGTRVDVTFVREGVEGPSTVSIPRRVVEISDVKLATLLGDPKEGLGYVQLSGFSANAGREVRNAILGLQHAALESGSGGGLTGLVLDLRGNPGGLLTSAVDVASLLVPEGSDIVSAKGRGFPGILYRSRVDPILPATTKLAVLVNKQTASAAEIVSGAVQDLDVGVIVGSDRTFGKGLVQNVEELPYDTALKYTVAKYYTPSGRCIQRTNYKEGGGLNVEDGKYKASTVADRDKTTYYTKNGREVKDGGGVTVDYKVEGTKASALEVTLLRSGAYSDFAAQWSRENQLTNNLDVVDDSTYKRFQSFVMQKQKEGDIKLEAIYSGPIESLKKALKQSGYKGTTKELEQLRANLIREIERDFEKYKKDIKEDVGQNILARYLPESMLLEIGVRRDKQVSATLDLLRDDTRFNQLLWRAGGVAGGPNGSGNAAEGVSTAIASNVAGAKVSDDFRVMFR